VVLGTGHALDDGLFSLSPKSYATPLGSFPPDAKALEQLRQAGSGCLAPDDFAHRVEHSIEFQVLFLGITLQRNIPLVPILVGSLGKHLAIRRGIAEIPGVQEFLEALRAICGPGTLVVAGVDLSHVGPKFGHAEPAAVHEPDFREHDRKLLAALCRGSGEELWAEAQRVEDRFHVCGLATLATLLEILSGTTGEILAYQVWHEAATRSAVSFTAAMLIAYRAENAVWISPIEGGSPQRVIDLGKEKGAGDPFWSPDSRMVAVQPHNGDTELYIIPIDGTGRATATPTRIEVPGNGVPAGWTLENKIGFLFRSELKIALYTVNAAGGKPVQITPHGEDQSAPNWSLDGNRLFLDWKGRLSVVPADGGQPAAIPILSAKPILASGPVGAGNAVSPDGRTLVFSGTMNGVPAVNLWTIPVQGGEPTRLTSMQPPIEDRFPCWSPDGKEIAFLRWPDPTDWSTTRVCIIPVQGGQAREITKETDQVAISSVAWSPDGGLIAFYSRDGAVKVIPAAGGTARVVAQGALTKWQQRLSFSPNGRRLAYLDKSHKVTTVSVDGNGDPETVNIDLEDASFSDVVWSPDGERFVFKAVKGVAPELWLMEDFLPLVRR
jgi:AmmeMemoRadiSam system protein B